MRFYILLICLIFSISFSISAQENSEKSKKTKNLFDLEYSYSQNLAKVQKKEKWGFIDTNKNVVIPIKYEDASSFINGFSRVQQNSKIAFIDTLGNLVSDWFDYVYPFYNNLAKVKNENKIAFINQKGELASEWFDQVYEYYYGLKKVKKGNYWAFIDENGKRSTKWYYHADTLNRKIKFKLKNEKVSIYNEENEQISKEFNSTFWSSHYEETDILFDSLMTDTILASSNHRLYSEGIYLRREEGGGYAFYNDRNNKISKNFFKARNFYESVARVMNANAKIALIGASGKRLTPWFDQIYPFFNRLAIVKNNGKFAFLDKKGTLKTPWYEYVSSFSDELSKVSLNKKWGFIDNSGKEIIPLIYDEASSFSYGFSRVSSNGREFVINKKGETMTGNFNYISYFKDSITPISKNEKFAYINQAGNIISPWFDKVSNFSFGIAFVSLNGKSTLINNKGEQVIEWFDYLQFEANVIECINHEEFDYTPKLFHLNTSFEKYSIGNNFIDDSFISWNYTDREKNHYWNHLFYTDGLQVYLKKVEAGKDESKVVNLYKKAYLADFNGKKLTKYYDEIYQLKDSFIVVKNNKKFFLRNTYGKKISKKYTSIKYFHPGEIILYKGKRKQARQHHSFSNSRVTIKRKKLAFFNTKGEALTSFYKEIETLKTGGFMVKKHKKFALMSRDFQLISEWFNYIDGKPTNGMFIVEQRKKMGVISLKGNQIIEPIYEKIRFREGFIKASLDGIDYKFSNKGKIIN